MAERVATSVMPYTELEVAGPYDPVTKQGNFDKSRANIDMVIIHTMVGTVAGAAARFDNPSSNVSAHYGISRDGKLFHWLEEFWTAYHSGNYPMNQRSIGIEHEDNGDYNGTRPDALYATSAKLVKDICQFYGIPINREHIKKHSEVSDKPTGCPDALDIDRIVREAGGNPGSAGNPNIYKGYDLTNQESMKVAVDVLVRVQQGEFVDKSKYDSDIETLKKQVEDLKSQIENLEKIINQPKPTPPPVPVPPIPKPKPTLNQVLALLRNLFKKQ